jgi:hypothetical protein
MSYIDGKIFKMQVTTKKIDTRYLSFMEKFSALANRVPLSYIYHFLSGNNTTII